MKVKVMYLALSILVTLICRQSVSLAQTNVTNINFEDFITGNPNEINTWKNLTDNLPNGGGNIPSFLKGDFIINGCGLFGIGNDMYSHVFDCLAKVSAYRIDGSSVLFTTKFIQSKFYKSVTRRKNLIPAITVGPILSRSRGMKPKHVPFAVMRAMMNSRWYDNTPVNIWDFDPARRQYSDSNNMIVAALTDVPARSYLAVNNFSTASSHGMTEVIYPGIDGYYTAMSPAHPLYSQFSDDTFTVASITALNGDAEIVLVRESPSGELTVVGKTSPIQGGTPYIHSFGITKNYAIVVLQAFRSLISKMNQITEMGVLRGTYEEVNQTEVIIFDLRNGDVVLHKASDEKIFFYHSVSSFEMENAMGETEISIRLCAYNNSDMIVGEDQFMRLERALTGKEARNRIPKSGKFCDVVINMNKESISFVWKKMKEDQGFELPTTRYSRSFGPDAVLLQHPRFVYAFGPYAFGAEYDNMALFKFDMELNRISASFHRDSVYVLEPTFIADPSGTDEDDGVVMTQMYDGIRRETALLILDAKTMDVLEEVWTGQRSPLTYHSTWIPRTK